MFDQQATKALIAHRYRALEQVARQEALLAEVRAGAVAVRRPARQALAAWVGERLIRLGEHLGAAPATATPRHT